MRHVDGIVIRGVGGFFDVESSGNIERCRARGVFRKRGTTVLVGDKVDFVPGSESNSDAGEGVITHVHPRTTELIRPPMANCDHAVLVFSVQSPEFHPQLLDRTLVAVTDAGLSATLVLSKTDLASADEIENDAEPYRFAGYEVLTIGRHDHVEVLRLREALSGHLSVFAGPSGAGKSSLANLLEPQLGLKMGSVSEKLGRGRHTTRHVELFRLGPDTYVADAPGFSKLDVQVASSELRLYFPEFVRVAEDCEYRGCLHINETQCAVKELVASGDLSRRRYESYQALYEEIKTREERRY